MVTNIRDKNGSILRKITNSNNTKQSHQDTAFPRSNSANNENKLLSWNCKI